MSRDKSLIYFTKNPDRKRFVSSLMSKFISNIKGKVLLKVNLVSYNPYPTTTHPEMIEAVYNQIKSKASEILCGDGQGVDVSSSKIENHPIIEKCKELGISFMVLGGGEPLVRSSIIDITSEFPEIIFLVFTNGLLIDEEWLAKLKKQPNFVPVKSGSKRKAHKSIRSPSTVHRLGLLLSLKLTVSLILISSQNA